VRLAADWAIPAAWEPLLLDKVTGAAGGRLDLKQRLCGAERGFAAAETLKVLRPRELHCNVDAWSH